MITDKEIKWDTYNEVGRAEAMSNMPYSPPCHIKDPESADSYRRGYGLGEVVKFINEFTNIPKAKQI